MKKSALQIASEVYSEIQYIDHRYFEYLIRTTTEKERIKWAKDNIQCFFQVGVDITPCMLGRAARELCTLCF